MKIIAAIVALGAILALPAYGQEKTPLVSVDRSPFYEARLYISRGVEVDKILIDARTHDNPPGTLRVEFFRIAKDRDPDNKPRYVLFADWGNVTIEVDTNQKGMTISYTQPFNTNWPHKLLLIVPSEEDRKLWNDTAEGKMQSYRRRFFEVKEELARQERQNEADRKAIEEILKEPRVVYPR